MHQIRLEHSRGEEWCGLSTASLVSHLAGGHLEEERLQWHGKEDMGIWYFLTYSRHIWPPSNVTCMCTCISSLCYLLFLDGGEQCTYMSIFCHLTLYSLVSRRDEEILCLYVFKKYNSFRLLVVRVICCKFLSLPWWTVLIWAENVAANRLYPCIYM